MFEFFSKKISFVFALAIILIISSFPILIIISRLKDIKTIEVKLQKQIIRQDKFIDF